VIDACNAKKKDKLLFHKWVEPEPRRGLLAGGKPHNKGFLGEYANFGLGLGFLF